MPKRAEIVLYAEDGWDSGRIISVIEQKQSIKEYAFILHDSDLDELGQPKKPHYHVYLGFGNCNLQFQHVAAWFQVKPQMVQKIKTSKLLLLKYYLHCNCPEKSQYPLEKLTASFDVQKLFQTHAQAMRLEDILERCAQGIITRQNFQEFIDRPSTPKTRRKSSTPGSIPTTPRLSPGKTAGS